MGYALIIEPFGGVWWWNTGLFIAAILCTTIIVSRANEKVIGWLGMLLLTDLIFEQFAYLSMGDWSWEWALPLQYCTIVELLSAITLITRRQWAYECVLFIGMVGPLQAIIAPAFPYEHGYFIFNFYLGHAAPFFVVCLFTFVCGYRPRVHAWWQRVVEMAFVTVGVFYFDFFAGANYMFLIDKPLLNHPLLGIGTWPMYIGFWFGCALGFSGVTQTLFVGSQWIASTFRRQTGEKSE